jgi:hypothetical protein
MYTAAYHGAALTSFVEQPQMMSARIQQARGRLGIQLGACAE